MMIMKQGWFLLLITWKESLDLLNDGLITGVPFSLAHLTPIPDKLLYSRLKFVHVKRRGWTHFARIILLKWFLKGKSTVIYSISTIKNECKCQKWTESYPFTVILHIFKHMETVLNDSLQNLLVMFGALADPGQVWQNTRNQWLMVRRKALELTLSSDDLLLNVGPAGANNPIMPKRFYD